MYRLISVFILQAVCVAMLLLFASLLELDVSLILLSLAGALLGAVVWLLQDLSSGSHYLVWLRKESHTSLPKLVGRWGEVANRTYRLLSEQKKNLISSNQRLEDFLLAIQASPNGVILLDKNGQIEWCNLTAASHFGLNAQEDILQHVGNLVRHPDFLRYFNAGKYSESLTISIQNTRNNKTFRLAIQIHRYGAGKKLVLSNDVTAIETAELMRRDFVANVSHEIRTPMTVLSGFVETLQLIDLGNTDRAKYLDLMQKQTFRIQLLVDDLLTLSKIEGNPAPSVNTWIKASDLIALSQLEADALNANLIDEKTEKNRDDEIHELKHAIVFEVDLDLELAGSQTELLSAMCNLINNAVRYTPIGGEIRVSLQTKNDGSALFSVEDSGLGILPEHLPRLTERFYRVDASRSRESGGTGLGLAIVKHVVQRHGGELKVISAMGKGSTFSFSLPSSRVRASVKTLA